jgi:hypothetical protein
MNGGIKQIMGLIRSALFCLGAAWIEYAMTLRFGGIFVVFVVASFLGVLLVALFRAPEAPERTDGFRGRGCDRSGPVRSVRLFQQRLRRQWT